jgi:hypothetical protein
MLFAFFPASTQSQPVPDMERAGSLVANPARKGWVPALSRW